MNKAIGDILCTVFWHADDFQRTHVRPEVVDNVSWHLDENYIKIHPLTTAKGRVHNCLGMLIDFINTGKVRVKIPKHVQSILETTPCGHVKPHIDTSN